MSDGEHVGGLWPGDYPPDSGAEADSDVHGACFAPTLTLTATIDTYRPAPSATATATPEPILYRVEPGDTLDLIVARYGVPKSVLRE